jgi:hypothetical protein
VSLPIRFASDHDGSLDGEAIRLAEHPQG